MSVEEELWNIFSFYSLTGNPLDPEFISGSQFMKLAKHCQLLELPTVDAPTVNVLYTREVKKHKGVTKKRNTRGEKMSYDGFLNALMNLSAKVHTLSRHLNEEEILTNVFYTRYCSGIPPR
jgi:hypothetical protein